jgi:tRNA 2-thiouridine synthesizing protein D
MDQGSLTSFKFAQHLIDKNHQIECIFFYQNGVYHAQEYNLPADEINVSQKWLQFSKKHHIQITACSTALEKRGIKNAPFDVKGLGFLAEAMLKSDRVVEF